MKPSADEASEKRCCGRRVIATWDGAGRGIWKCKRCGKPHGTREGADLGNRKGGRRALVKRSLL
jgi:hypothetical protein